MTAGRAEERRWDKEKHQRSGERELFEYLHYCCEKIDFESCIEERRGFHCGESDMNRIRSG